MRAASDGQLSIAVVGSGIAGLAAGWLLSRRHAVTLYEQDRRPGGHANTVTTADGQAVDTGFIVYNEATYPNLTALFRHLGVATQPTDMSFAVSLDGGRLEYAGTNLAGLFAQPANLLRPRFWSMLRDLARFYRSAPTDTVDPTTSLGAYLDALGYGAAFQQDHLLPMAAAIWSASADGVRAYPAAGFIRFCDTHGLLQVRNRPVWRTVTGGSRSYVQRIVADLGPGLRLGQAVRSVRRLADGVALTDAAGTSERFDHVVLATHADQALRLLADPDPLETRLLGAFRYDRNLAVLHQDPGVMPKRRRVWASWNYVGTRAGSDRVGVTYWMNRLQGLPDAAPLFVTLNPDRMPRSVLHSEIYEHPQLDVAATLAQRHLWSLQGVRRTWFCGAWFGAGFHEDGVQSGLAVAEQLGGLRRPWTVPDENGRIVVTDSPAVPEPVA
jgi:predicted NAD/FAD-binding protein